MSVPIEDSIRRLLQGPNYAHVATTGPGGAPQTTSVWILDEGDSVVIYKEPSSVAMRNLRRNPQLAISLVSFEDPYLGCTIAARVAEVRGEPDAKRWLRERAVEYTGADFPAAELPPEGVLIVAEVERQSWHHFDDLTHAPSGAPVKP
jgi:PPOX class probable F420-dependent enzyme